MQNLLVFGGNLTKDPEFKYFPNSGERYAIISIANNSYFLKKDGSKGEKVCYLEVNVYGKSADTIERFFKKGSRIIIEGELRQESWEKDGVKKSKHTAVARKIHILDFPKNEQQGIQEGTNVDMSNVIQNNNEHNNQLPQINIDDDEIPF